MSDDTPTLDDAVRLEVKEDVLRRIRALEDHLHSLEALIPSLAREAVEIRALLTRESRRPVSPPTAKTGE